MFPIFMIPLLFLLGVEAKPQLPDIKPAVIGAGPGPVVDNSLLNIPDFPDLFAPENLEGPGGSIASPDDLVDLGDLQTKKQKAKPSTNNKGGTPSKSNESEVQVDAAGDNGKKEESKGMPFEFSYGVNDEKGNDHSHQSKSDGETTVGEYSALLPDGRVQTVKYEANLKRGFRIISIKYTKK